MAKTYKIREVCGDWALHIPPYGKMDEEMILIFNSRNNAELVKSVLEWEDAHPNAAVPYMPTLTPPNEWVSVEDAVPDPGERVLATDGIFVGEAYRTSADSWHRHTGFPWRDGVTGRTVKYWMLLPAPPDRRPPEGET